jgi:hypothetical protein
MMNEKPSILERTKLFALRIVRDDLTAILVTGVKTIKGRKTK